MGCLSHSPSRCESLGAWTLHAARRERLVRLPTMPSRAMNGTMNGAMNGTMNGSSEIAPAECLDDGGALAIAEARRCCSPIGWRIRQEVHLLLMHGGLC